MTNNFQAAVSKLFTDFRDTGSASSSDLQHINITRIKTETAKMWDDYQVTIDRVGGLSGKKGEETPLSFFHAGLTGFQQNMLVAGTELISQPIARETPLDEVGKWAEYNKARASGLYPVPWEAATDVKMKKRDLAILHVAQLAFDAFGSIRSEIQPGLGLSHFSESVVPILQGVTGAFRLLPGSRSAARGLRALELPGMAYSAVATTPEITRA
jgi:hypothetical protein